VSLRCPNGMGLVIDAFGFSARRLLNISLEPRILANIRMVPPSDLILIGDKRCGSTGHVRRIDSSCPGATRRERRGEVKRKPPSL
jgi:hypothetical protein